VIAAMRTFTAQLVKWETGRPLRLASPDVVQPLSAAALPARSPRLPSTRTSVRQPERVAPSGAGPPTRQPRWGAEAPHLARRRGPWALLFAEHQVGLLGDGPRSVVQDFKCGGRCRSAARENRFASTS